jgi:hypothetical protein
MLKAWFQQQNVLTDSKKKVEVDEDIMAEAFKGVSELFTFSTEQLLELLDIFTGKSFFPI